MKENIFEKKTEGELKKKDNKINNNNTSLDFGILVTYKNFQKNFCVETIFFGFNFFILCLF